MGDIATDYVNFKIDREAARESCTTFAQHNYSHCLGCVWAHYPVSRLIVLLNMASCQFDQKAPIFGPTWTWKVTWMGRIGAQHIFPNCLECVLAHYPVSRLIFWSIWHPFILAIFDQKTPIFGPTWTWNDTWMGHKSAQHIFSHCLGCVLAHYPVSRWVIGLVWQPTMMVHFDPKKGFFCPPPDLKMAPGEDSMASSHLAICIRKLLVHFEFKVPINVVGRAKNLQK